MPEMCRRVALVLCAAVVIGNAAAQNPIICDRYTPDPAPYVHDDTLYLFVDHDEDETLNGYFTMKDWLLYSTVDMVNWTYGGKVMGQADGSFTIHGGSVEFRGHHYMFYHNGKLPGGGGLQALDMRGGVYPERGRLAAADKVHHQGRGAAADVGSLRAAGGRDRQPELGHPLRG